MSLPLALAIEKNRLCGTAPWLMLIEIVHPSISTVRLVRNTDNVTFQGNVYTAFPFEVDPLKSDSAGEIPQLTLRVSNVTRGLQSSMEQTKGMVGATVTLTIVHADNLSADYADLTAIFDVLAAVSDAQWVTFTLGAPNPLRRRYPQYTAIANYCNWQFKSAECAYTGSDSTCKRTLESCQAKGNSGRFGGRPGLNSRFRLV